MATEVAQTVLLLSLLILGAGPDTALAPVPGGVYTPLYSVGSREVEVQPFYLESYPVTNAQFLEFVLENPTWRRSQVKPLFAEGSYLAHWESDLTFAPELAERPVVNVSWFAARAYCQAKGLRLPTQDEWESTARASETSADASSDPDFRQRILDWYSRPTPGRPDRVGSTFRNVHGVHDMHGLVWEWVEDYNTILVTGESRGDGDLDRGLYCAAGVSGSVDPGDYAAYMRYAFRSSLKPNYTLGNLGFRCAADTPARRKEQ